MHLEDINPSDAKSLGIDDNRIFIIILLVILVIIQIFSESYGDPFKRLDIPILVSNPVVMNY